MFFSDPQETQIFHNVSFSPTFYEETSLVVKDKNEERLTGGAGILEVFLGDHV